MPPYTWAVNPNNNNAETGKIDQGNNNTIVYNIAAGQFPYGISLASIPLLQTWFPILMNIQNTILLTLQNI